MSKLLKFKEWITLPEAARHLSTLFSEEVSEADIIRFGLDGHLQISVNFVNHGKARKGTVVVYPIQQMEDDLAKGIFHPTLKWVTYPAGTFPSPHPAADKEVTSLVTLRIDEDRYLPLSENVETMVGVWDLAMVGTERLDLEHRFQNLTDGPRVTLEGMEGAFVKINDHEMWQVQESFDDNEFQTGSTRQKEILEAKISFGEIPPEQVESSRKKFKEERDAFLARRKTRPKSEGYYPGSLPPDAVFVVRTSAISEFVRSVNDDSAEKEVSTRERDVMLKLILGMAMKGYGFVPRAHKSAVPKEIEGDLAGLNMFVGDDTVRKYLRLAVEKVLPRKSEE